MKNLTKIAGLAVAFIASIVVLGTQAQTTPQVTLTIQTGGTSCIYGTSVNFGTSSVQASAINFSGNFNTASGTNDRSCTNNNGISSSTANLSIVMSGNVVNQSNTSTFISSGNVTISFNNTAFAGGLTGTVRSGTNVALNTGVVIFGISSTADARIGSMTTTGVKLAVTTNANQAPGTYQGTIVISLPW